MKPYLINSLGNDDGFDAIVTILDHEVRLTECMKAVRVSPCGTGKILVDAALYSGLNEYRFIEMPLNADGTVSLDQYHYVSVSDGILEKANGILRHHPDVLENTMLSDAAVRRLKQERRKEK